MLTRGLLLNEEKDLERELAGMEPVRRRLELVREMLKTFPTAEGKEIILPPNGSRFAGMSISEAIMRFLEDHPGALMLPSEIRAGLLAGGFTSQAERFSTVVIMACKRLAAHGTLDVGTKNGFTAYKAGKTLGTNIHTVGQIVAAQLRKQKGPNA